MFRAISIALIFFAALSPLAHAQTLGLTPLTLTLDPAYPRPYDDVTITLASNSIDLSNATITITVNGTAVNEGGRSALAHLGGPGSTTAVKAAVVSGGQTYTTSLTLRPSEVSVIVEPGTGTHPFYKGASLVAPNGNLRLIAIPDVRVGGVRQPAASLSYTWKLGEETLEAQSGVGKNVLVATAPERYRDATVSVTVTTPDGGTSAQASVLVSPSDPALRLYELDPLLGPRYERALTGTFTLPSAEETLRAVGYFFGSPPSYAWTLNGTRSGADADITLRSSGSAGSASLSASASSAQGLANASLGLTFTSNSAGAGIFGL